MEILSVVEDIRRAQAFSSGLPHKSITHFQRFLNVGQGIERKDFDFAKRPVGKPVHAIVMALEPRPPQHYSHLANRNLVDHPHDVLHRH